MWYLVMLDIRVGDLKDVVCLRTFSSTLCQDLLAIISQKASEAPKTSKSTTAPQTSKASQTSQSPQTS